MIRYLRHSEGRYWLAKVIDDTVEVRYGADGEEPTIDMVDTWAELGQPPECCLDELAEPMLESGYHFHSIPDVHLVIEAAHGVVLPQRFRRFYSSEEYLLHQFKHLKGLGCDVDFVADSVLGNYMQEHWDAERGESRSFIPISARVYDGYEDEQQWIGIDPKESPTVVYALYTSGAFEVAYESLDALLNDLEAPVEE